MNKIIESFNKLNDQARYGVFTAVVILIIGLDVFFLGLLQYGSITSVNDQIKKLSGDTQQVTIDRQRIKQLKKNLQATRLEFKALSMRIRTREEVPAISSTISSVAKEYGVKIDQLNPEYSQEQVLKKSPEGNYIALPVVIKARCGYHMFGKFLNKLENENLYFIMKDFIVQNDEKDPSARLFSLTINIILLTPVS